MYNMYKIFGISMHASPNFIFFMWEFPYPIVRTQKNLQTSWPAGVVFARFRWIWAKHHIQRVAKRRLLFCMFIHAMFALVHDAFPLLVNFRAADDTRAGGLFDGCQLAHGVLRHLQSLRRVCYRHCNITLKKDQVLY